MKEPAIHRPRLSAVREPKSVRMRRAAALTRRNLRWAEKAKETKQ